MSLRAPLLVLALAVAGCAPTYGRGPDTTRDWSDAPLDARLYGGGRQLRVDVNQPAYVAIFEMAPGRGVGLVYPQGTFEDNRLITRSEWVSTFTRSAGGNRWFSSAGMSFYQDFAGPARFYLLIASKRPLNTAQFLHKPLTLRHALGIHASTTSEMEVLDALVSHVVPSQPDEDWTTDVLAVWPDANYGGGYQRSVVRVLCPDGTVVLVPREFAGYACRRSRQTAPPPNSDTTHVAGPIRPGGRRPRPAEPSTPADGIATPETRAARRERPTTGDDEVATRRGRPSSADEGARQAPSQPRSDPARQPARAEPRTEPAHVTRASGGSESSGSSRGSTGSPSSSSSGSSGTASAPSSTPHGATRPSSTPR